MNYWSLVFFAFSILFALASLINDDLQTLAVGLLFSIMGVLTERKTK